MIILGIESSCDDTSIALIGANETGFKILAEKTASQIEVHKKYGGVVPEIAGRCHAENITPLLEEILKGQPKPEVIAVTSGPGLITGLLVGVEAAKSLSYLLNIPIVSVNHIEGHIHSVELNSKIEYPALALIVSGGHTELILIPEQGKYKKIGSTKDDAAGECFDKVAKLLGFDYPGGPKISKFAETGNPKAIAFPRPMLGIHDDNLDFSFSGLKTSTLYWLQKHTVIASQNEAIQSPTDTGSPRRFAPRDDTTIHDFCASFEQAIIDVLVAKTLKATKTYKPKTVILGGGVSANKKLRKTLQTAITSIGCELLAPNLKYAMDNAAMIATAGYYKALKKDFTSWQNIKADPNWKITS